MRVVVVASGDLDAADARRLDVADMLIAADGGARSLDGLGRRPDLVVGDLDSADEALVARLAAEGTRIESHPADKDASDADLAVRAALRAGASEVVLTGAIGGARLDHALANVLLLAGRALAGHDVRLASGGTTVRVVRGGERVELEASAGDGVTLLPIGGDATGVTTRGLRWPLERAALRLGSTLGLSNEVADAPASVSLDAGVLLVIEIPQDTPTQLEIES